MGEMILIADRTNRVQDRVLERVDLTSILCRELASENIGLLVGKIPEDKLIRHASWIARNASPHSLAIACTNYDLVEEITERLQKWDIAAIAIRRNERVQFTKKFPQVVVTVPERLTAMAEFVRARIWSPLLLLQVDLNGWCHQQREWKGRVGARAENIGRFRAACMAAGAHPVVIKLSAIEAAAVSLDLLVRDLAVEYIHYLRGDTLRTAGITELAETTSHLASGHEHPLDAFLTQHYARRSHVLLAAIGQTGHYPEGSLRSFAAQRGYPVVSLNEVFHGIGGRDIDSVSVEQAKDQLERAVREVNKRVIVIVGLDWFAVRFGPHAAMVIVAWIRSDSLLLVSWPSALATSHLVSEIRAMGDVVSGPRVMVTAQVSGDGE